METGFLALFIAFVIKSEYAESSAFTQLLLLGVVGVAAGIGGFLGNAIGARMPLSKPDLVSIGSLAAVVLTTLIAALIPGLITAAIVGLVGSTASALAKVCLDSVIQHELPEASRASAFGVSETALQLSWVFGGVVGLLIGGVWTFGHDSVYTIGFAVVTVLLAVGLTQSWLVRRARRCSPGCTTPSSAPGSAGARARRAPPSRPPGCRPDPAAGYQPPAGWVQVRRPSGSRRGRPGRHRPGTAGYRPGYPAAGTRTCPRRRPRATATSGGRTGRRRRPPTDHPPGHRGRPPDQPDAAPTAPPRPADAGSPRRKTRDP